MTVHELQAWCEQQSDGEALVQVYKGPTIGYCYIDEADIRIELLDEEQDDGVHPWLKR